MGLCPQERRLAVLLYGFPPGVGATGTAALLNVPRSLAAMLNALKVAPFCFCWAQSHPKCCECMCRRADHARLATSLRSLRTRSEEDSRMMCLLQHALERGTWEPVWQGGIHAAMQVAALVMQV